MNIDVLDEYNVKDIIKEYLKEHLSMKDGEVYLYGESLTQMTKDKEEDERLQQEAYIRWEKERKEKRRSKKPS